LPIGEASQGGIWAGAWTGFRPVGWAIAILGGRERLYCASHGAKLKNETHIHIWEAMTDDRTDNGGRIACQMETGGIFSSDRERFRYAELDLCEIYGTVDVDVYFGGTRGPWQQILEHHAQGRHWQHRQHRASPLIKYDELMEAFKPQTRILRTNEFQDNGKVQSGPEGSDKPSVDKAFQILVQWRGRMAVRGINVVTEEYLDPNKGEKCPVSEASQTNAINERGEVVT
jgi:hypothetical protein